jgi:hypothetical protein
MLSQIIVSVAAAVCVAFITNAYLDTERAAVADRNTPVTEASAEALPPLDVEVIADAPEVIGPAHEVFPGVPAGVAIETLRTATAKEGSGDRRRRFLGIPIPFTSTAADVGAERVRGG